MDPTPASPWQPDRRWADPLIVLLATLAILASLLTLLSKQIQARKPAARASLQARLAEPMLFGPRLLGARMPVQGASLARLDAQTAAPWDRALLAVLAAESGDLPRARSLAQAPLGPEGDAFRAAFQAAYGNGPLPPGLDAAALSHRLGDGYAAALLEARLQDRRGAGGDALRAAAREALLRRLALLGAAGFAILALALGGAAFGIVQLAARREPPLRPLPSWGLSGRGAALVFLLWFLAFFLAGNLAAAALRPWPALRWLAVPLGYGAHAAAGVALLCRAEGLSPRALWRRVAPSPAGPALLQGLGFLALAVTLVIALSLALGPFIRSSEGPQRELVDLLRGLQGWGPTLAMFLVVAGLAPCFEELLFRGFLLPVLARRMPMAGAVLASALLFGAIHLQPLGLPTLSMLGVVLGLAARRTGSLWTPVLVHACWNGSVFVLMRVLGA